ncbi:MAG: transcriptional regulator [Rhodospirillaceae bacterium]|nr:transcriptional regulator [Rhodospirillaceae bacterium]
MEIKDFLFAESIIKLKASSKKQLLQMMARRASSTTGISEQKIFDTVLERERLGTTGVGNGVAIPHGKLSSLQAMHGVFACIEKAVPFESLDEKPVDLVFMLLAPEKAGADHLKALARVSRLLRDPVNCEKLRGTETEDGIYMLLTTAEAKAA